MTMLAYVDYAFIVLFFLGLAGVVALITIPKPVAEVEAKAPPVRENKAAYGFLAALLVSLLVLTLLVQRQQAHASS
ncbi:MAG TPA: hypothetical protein VKV20_12190 [Ktedonobacteraceae bacterium]|jgi:hypothetical protein|nr:hypothetical protein [Ktedonobacteraceae bacterium]